MTGVWRAVAYCEGAVVVFHSPRACAHVARSMDINSHLRSLADEMQETMNPVPLTSSQLETKHSIFGGADRLRKCLRETVRLYAPELIVVAGSCLAGVMGDDVPAIACEAEAELGVPVLTVNTYGFLDGEYYQGYFDTAHELLKRYMYPQKREAHTALLLGDSGGPWNHYALEVKRILRELGINVLGQFPSYLPVRELGAATRAQASVVLSSEGPMQAGLLELAAEFKEKFSVDYLPDAHYPLDWEDTQKFIMDMGRLFDCEQAAAQVLERERADMNEALRNFLPATRGRRAALCVGRWLSFFKPRIIAATLRRLEYKIVGAVLLPGFPERERALMQAELKRLLPDGAPILGSDDAAADELLRSADQVFTTHELRGKNLRQVWLPLNPIIGKTGEINFMRGLCRALSSRHVGGGITYVY